MTKRSDFEWDSSKDKLNQEKHSVSFALAQLAFLDHNRVILEDLEHSDDENRYYCLGEVASEIMTVRFTYRKKIRIIGAGYWRKGKKIYETKADVRSLLVVVWFSLPLPFPWR
ncbi:MAG: BrnT family toxin [Deltaproteobacteria bacterium]|nr:BrnT family toxin [Deltaproteobacteria bacterium]